MRKECGMRTLIMRAAPELRAPARETGPAAGKRGKPAAKAQGVAERTVDLAYCRATVGMLAEREAICRQLEALDVRLGPRLLDLYGEHCKGRATSAEFPVAVEVGTKTSVAWKEEFIRIAGKAQADAILAATPAKEYHYVLIEELRAPYSVETVKEQLEKLAKRRAKDAVAAAASSCSLATVAAAVSPSGKKAKRG